MKRIRLGRFCPIKPDPIPMAPKPATVQELTIDLTDLGLYHAAPRVDGRPILAMRLDTASGTLVPARPAAA